MENIAEPLAVTCLLKLEIANGKSVRAALRALTLQKSGQFVEKLGVWLKAFDHDSGANKMKWQSTHRGQLVRLLEIGLQGVPILDSLDELEKHMIAVCEEDMQRHLDQLPTKLSIPMVLCFLPSFFILIISPVFEFLKSGVA